MNWHWFTMPDGTKEPLDLDHCYRIQPIVSPPAGTANTILYFLSAGPVGVMDTFQEMAVHLPAQLTAELENPATLPPTPVVRRRL